jgi:N4-gp56 family major capsid protein
LLAHIETNLVLAQFAKKYDFTGEGSVFKVNVLVEPAAAAALTESTMASVTAWEATTTVSFTPTEYGKAFQLSDKEARRSFFDVMSEMMANLGYSLARARDALCYTRLYSGAGNSIVANGVVASSLASSDTLDSTDLRTAIAENEADKFVRHTALIIHPYQKKSLMGDAQFANFYQVGDNSIPRNGLLGTLYGVPVYVSTAVTVTSSTAKAILISAPDAFGFGVKANPRIETQRQALGRFTDIVASEEYDVQVLKANSVCLINSYCA